MSDPSNPMQNPYSQYGGGAPAAAAPGPKGITVADLITAIGAVVTFIFSFLAFYDFGDASRNAWSRDAGAFVTTIPAILALAMAVVVGLGLANVKLPDRVLTFSWDQVAATWGISAAGVMIAFLTVDTTADRGVGFWLMLIGSLAMATGAILKLLGLGTDRIGGGTAQSGYPQQQQQGYPPQGAQPPAGGYQQPGGQPPPGGQQPGQGGGNPPPPPPGL